MYLFPVHFPSAASIFTTHPLPFKPSPTDTPTFLGPAQTIFPCGKHATLPPPTSDRDHLEKMEASPLFSQ